VGWDPLFDLALVKVEVKAPSIIRFGLAKDAKAGQKVVAIGSPVGLENSIASGIVSAPARELFQLGSALQIDVPVNPGNSGGPLLDEAGLLVGIVNAGAQGYQGLNFAIPASTVLADLPSLYSGGLTSHQWLGMGLSEDRAGLRVEYLSPRLPSSAAELPSPAILEAINGVKVAKLREARALAARFSVGSLVRLSFSLPDGSKADRILALSNRPQQPFAELLRYELPENLFVMLYGFEARQIGRDLSGPSFEVSRVVPGSNAEVAGFASGDRFTVLSMGVDAQNGLVVVNMRAKLRKTAFLESFMGLTTALESNLFL
jgi:serine protease Do